MQGSMYVRVLRYGGAGVDGGSRVSSCVRILQTLGVGRWSKVCTQRTQYPLN